MTAVRSVRSERVIDQRGVAHQHIDIIRDALQRMRADLEELFRASADPYYAEKIEELDAALAAINASAAPPPVDANGLLPCPHCDGAAESSTWCSEDTDWYIYCKLCLASSGFYDEEDEAAAAWNRRTATPQPMPSADWSQLPDVAIWWCVNADGRVGISDDREPIAQEGWSTWTHAIGIHDGYGRFLRINIPLGIDWRTLKQQRPPTTTQEK